MSVLLVDSATPLVDTAAAVPGLNAQHTWYPAGGGPAVVLNPPPAPALPRVRLTGEIAGWGNPPPGEDRRTTPVGRVLAERPLRSGRHGKTLTYQGVVEASNDIELRNATGALARAFGDPNMGEGRMVVAPWDGRPAVEYWARVTGYDCPEAYPAIAALGRRSRGFERSFTLQVHLSRGRMFSTVLRSVTSNNPAGVAVSCNGNAPTEPIITTNDVAGGELTIVNVTTGERLVLVSTPQLPLGTFDAMVFDFAARTIFASGPTVVPPGNARAHLDRARADWWNAGGVGLRPGAQTIGFAGAASMTVQWRDAWW